MMNSTSEPVVYGNLRLRILARLFDMTLYCLLQVVALWLITYLDTTGGLAMRGPIIGIFVGTFFISLLYLWLLSANGRQTPGYILAGLEVQTVDGQPLSLWRALWRAVVLFAFINLWCCAIVPLLFALFNSRKRAAHDYLCGTQVVKVRSARIAPLFATVGTAVVIFMGLEARLIFPFPLQAYYLPSGSMEDTLHLNDRLLANNQIYRSHIPKNGEIAVFKAPPEALIDTPDPNEEVEFVKRVVAVPGQKAEIVKGQLKINGQAIDEPYKKPVATANQNFDLFNLVYNYDMKVVKGKVYSREYPTEKEAGLWMQNGMAVSEEEQVAITQAKTESVPAGQLLVLGDNRGNSNDSHVWGFTPISSLRGRVMLSYWPLSHWRWFSDSDSPKS